MTGRPSRVALWVTVLSGVIGIPARGCDGICALFGGEGAVASAFGLLTCPCRFARAVIRIDGSAFGFAAVVSWAGGVCADVDRTPAESAGASTNVAMIKKRAGERPALRPR
jgi:hypothetical protein